MYDILLFQHHNLIRQVLSIQNTQILTTSFSPQVRLPNTQLVFPTGTIASLLEKLIGKKLYPSLSSTNQTCRSPTTSAQCSPLPPCARSSSTFFCVNTVFFLCVIPFRPMEFPVNALDRRSTVSGRWSQEADRKNKKHMCLLWLDVQCSAPVRFTLKVQCLRFFSSNIYSFMQFYVRG